MRKSKEEAAETRARIIRKASKEFNQHGIASTGLADVMKTNLEKILSTGCLIKDLDIGLLDFPAIVNNEEVYLCWKLGEDRIRSYHKQDEGYAGRKPLDPRDLGPGDKVQ